MGALSGGPPRVSMVQPTEAGHDYNFAVTYFPSLDRPLVGRVFPQCIVSPILMIIAEVLANQPSQVAFVESRSRGPVIPSGNSPPIFRPPHSARDSDRLSGPVRYSSIGRTSVASPSRTSVAIQDQVARCGVVGKSFSQAAADPRAVGWAVGDHEKQYKTRNFTVGTVKKSMAAITSRWFFTKTTQRLRGILRYGPLAQVPGDGALRNLEPSFKSSPCILGAPQEDSPSPSPPSARGVDEARS